MKIISLGLGLQSSTMYLMSCLGELPRADYAIFADPGAEHPKTYEYLKWLLNWQKENDDIPIFVEKKSLYDDLLKQQNSLGVRIASLPTFTENGTGILRRQCTNEYKIEVVMKRVKNLHQLKRYARMKPTEIWIGITVDEASRMKDSPKFNITNKYPLIDLMMNRSDCRKWLESKDFPVPVKSSCVFCPYSSNGSWKRMKQDSEVWDKVVKVDNSIRSSGKLKEKTFLHRSCKPIDEVYLQEDQEDLFDNECEGYCGL